jgi:hypothetical protein
MVYIPTSSECGKSWSSPIILLKVEFVCIFSLWMITSPFGSYHVPCHSSLNVQSYECKTVKCIDDWSVENMYPEVTP